MAYLRPETAQGMFLQLQERPRLDAREDAVRHLRRSARAFRNEVTPRNFIFRSREFEQMELEFFVHPSEATKWYQLLARDALRLVVRRSASPARTSRLRDHEQDELAHYAKESGGCCDVEYAFPFSGREGLHRARGHRLPERLRPQAARRR